MKQIILLTLAAVALIAADATGKWTGTLTVMTAKPGPAYLVLKQEGEKLTGTAGPDAGEQHPMQAGKAENGILTFEVPSGSMVMKFALKQEGEEIKGGVTRERQGEKQTAKLAVKREAPVNAQGAAAEPGPLRSKIESRVLAETREMIVHLPESYGREAVRRVFAANAPMDLRWQVDRTAGADHSSNGERAAPAGFQALYRKLPTP